MRSVIARTRSDARCPRHAIVASAAAPAPAYPCACPSALVRMRGGPRAPLPLVLTCARAALACTHPPTHTSTHQHTTTRTTRPCALEHTHTCTGYATRMNACMLAAAPSLHPSHSSHTLYMHLSPSPNHSFPNGNGNGIALAITITITIRTWRAASWSAALFKSNIAYPCGPYLALKYSYAHQRVACTQVIDRFSMHLSLEFHVLLRPSTVACTQDTYRFSMHLSLEFQVLIRASTCGVYTDYQTRTCMHIAECTYRQFLALQCSHSAHCTGHVTH